jgi:uncharacterized protein (DUF488 family)
MAPCSSVGNMAAEGLTIWTVGHSNKTIDDFLTILRSHNIDLVADVRRFPGSRRYPHFGQEKLRAALQEKGISYGHFEDLGGRREARKDSPNMAWRNEGFRGYADYMETAEFRSAMEAFMSRARKQPTAIMCAEALWWQCHRSMIADYLLSLGCEVLHILGPEKTEPHRYSAPARIVNGRLTYHSDPTEELALK